MLATEEDIENVSREEWFKKFSYLVNKQNNETPASCSTGGCTYGESTPLVLFKLFVHLAKKHQLDSSSVFADIGAGIGKVLLFFCQMLNCPSTLLGFECDGQRVNLAAKLIHSLKVNNLKTEGVRVLEADGEKLKTLVIL